MTQEMMIDFAIGQVGEEKAKEVVGMILKLADKMSSKQVYMLKKIPQKGVCLIMTNEDIAVTKFTEKPKLIELEKIVRGIEFE